MRRHRPSPDQAAAQALRRLLGARPFSREAWAAMLTGDCHVRIGNAPPAIGRGSALDRLSALMARTAGVPPAFWAPCHAGPALYVECEMRVFDAEGDLRALPCAIVARAADAPFMDLRFYLDLTPFASESAASALRP